MLHRYIIVLDRYDDDDHVFPKGETDSRPPATDEEGITQVAAELQEAMSEMGEPAGSFRVVARAEATDGEAIHLVTDSEVAHRAAMAVLDSTRTY